MNFKKNIPLKIKSSKKFKYGTSALVFTAVFVAFIVLINVLVSFIDVRSGGLYVDLTSKGLYEVSEASVKILDGVDIPVEIIFCQDRDKVEDETYLIHTKMLAESYEKNFKNVKIVYKDRIRDVAYFNENKFNKPGQEINYLSIIVNCPSTGLFKVYSWQNMYKFTEDGRAFAFDGENKITSAILSVARSEENMLRAGLVTGHGEDNNHNVQHFLEDLGYAVTSVDLKTVEMQELAKYDVLLVCNPKTDFIGMQKNVAAESGAEPSAETDSANESDANQSENTSSVTEIQQTGVNETGKLYDYVYDHFGNVMFFFDPSYASMPELEELLADRFGVMWINYCTVWDDGSAIAAFGNNPEEWRFQGFYSTDSTTDGYRIHKSMSEKDYYGTAPKPAFGMSCLLQIPKAQVDAFAVSPIVVTSDTAKAYLGSEEASAPGYPLMTLSKYTRLVGNNDKSGHVVVCGSMGFLDELDSPAYPNADLMKQTLSGMGGNSILSDIEWKVLDEVEIVQTQDQVNSMMKKLGIIIPVIIIVVGAVVFIKRKYL